MRARKQAASAPTDVTGVSKALQEYLDAANWSYNTFIPGAKGGPDLPDGLKFLTSKGKDVYSYDAATGFYGAALVTPEHKVVIVYEGTNFFTNNAQFTAGQVIDDANIYAGMNAPSYKSALQFAQTAMTIAGNKGFAKSDVSVDGHSLGAADAEYVAAKTGLGGTTFGTPGIPVSDSRPGHASKLTNYVEVNDPVGNYAANTTYPNGGSPLGPIVLFDSIKHFGGQTVLPDYIYDANDPAILEDAATDYKAGDFTDTAARLSEGLADHLLGTYAYGLGTSLAGADLTAGRSNGTPTSSVDPSWIEASLFGGGGFSAAAHSSVASAAHQVAAGLGAAAEHALGGILGHKFG